MKEACNTAHNTGQKRNDKALSLAKECYSMKLDLLTNATVVDDAIRFVTQNSIQKSLANSIEDNVDKQESDYEDEEPIEISHTSMTTSEVF